MAPKTTSTATTSLPGPDYGSATGTTGTSAEFGDSVWGVPTSLLGVTLGLSGHKITADERQYLGRTTGTTHAVGEMVTDTSDTVQNILESFNQLKPDDLYQLQLQLLVNGYDKRKPKNVLWGTPDPASYSAYARAVKTAARTGMPLDTILNRVDATPAALASLVGRGAVHSNVVQHDSKEDLDAAALKGFQAAIGRGPTEKEAADFLAGYRQKETKAQPETAGGGTFDVTVPGNPQTAAEAYAKQINPAGAAGMTRLNAFGTILNALGVQ